MVTLILQNRLTFSLEHFLLDSSLNKNFLLVMECSQLLKERAEFEIALEELYFMWKINSNKYFVEQLI